jgi:hypothetical protein
MIIEALELDVEHDKKLKERQKLKEITDNSLNDWISKQKNK